MVLSVSCILVGRQAQAQVLTPEDIPFTQDILLMKTRGDQLCVIQFVADKGSYKNYSLAIRKGKTWIRNFPLISVAQIDKSVSIEFKDIEFAGNRIYLGGSFKMYNSSRNCLLYLDKSGGGPWKADFEFSKNGGTPVVNALSGSGDFLYVGGSFLKVASTQVTGEFLNLFRMPVSTFLPARILLNKNNGTDSAITGLEYDTANKVMIVGGLFRKIAGQSFKGLAKLAPSDTSKVGEITVTKSLISVYKFRFINGKLIIFGLHDTSTTGPAIYIANGSLVKVKGSVGVYQVGNFFPYGSGYIASGYMKLTGQSAASLGLTAFTEAVPLTEIFRKLGTTVFADVLGADLFVAGNFKQSLFEFTLGRVTTDLQRFVGRVFADLDNSGTYTTGDKLIPRRNVHITANNGINNLIQTNATGFFTFPFSASQSTLYKVIVENLGELTSNEVYIFKSDTIKERLIDFPLSYKKSNYSDLTVRMTAATGWYTRKDTSEIYVLTVSNRGLTDMTVPKLNLNFSKVQDIKTFPPHNVTNAGSVTWNDQTVAAGEERSYIIKLTVPSANYNTGQTVQFSTALQGVVDDNTGNNSDSLSQTVTQGIAPFLKLQNPSPLQGDSFAWLTASLGKVDYTIRFSNFSTDTVNTVVVKDTISTPDYVTYIQETGASHSFSRQVYISPALPDKVIVAYTFSNIKLPPNPSGNSEVSSASGFISFRVGFDPTQIPGGTSLRNRASVYMEQNAPVSTNMVVAKIPYSNVYHADLNSQKAVFPNPFSDFLIFASEMTGADLAFYSLDGRLITRQQIMGNSLQTSNLGLKPGAYMYLIERSGSKLSSGILIKN